MNITHLNSICVIIIQYFNQQNIKANFHSSIRETGHVFVVEFLRRIVFGINVNFLIGYLIFYRILTNQRVIEKVKGLSINIDLLLGFSIL